MASAHSLMKRWLHQEGRHCSQLLFRAAVKDRLKKEKERKEKKKKVKHLLMHWCGGGFVRLGFKIMGRRESLLQHHRLYLFCGESTAAGAEPWLCLLAPPSHMEQPQAPSTSVHFWKLRCYMTARTSWRGSPIVCAREEQERGRGKREREPLLQANRPQSPPSKKGSLKKAELNEH